MNDKPKRVGRDLKEPNKIVDVWNSLQNNAGGPGE